jgi:hypothetical protein
VLTAGHLIVAATTVLVAILAVLLHYEAFLWLTRAFERTRRLSRRQRILVLVFSLLVLHVVEIWLFALTAWGLLLLDGTGIVAGPYVPAFLDYVYLSAVTFSTLGYGDLFPQGPIRFLYGTEGLTGFALITWSASLTFLEMQRHWRGD